jgi:hypothetical protein
MDHAVLDAGASSRKRFLKMLGGAGATGALGVLLAGCGGDDDEPSRATAGQTRFGEGDIGFANYALTLEYLEADFYARVAKSGKLSGDALGLVRRIGKAEREHVAVLEATVRRLGGRPVARPKASFPLESEEQILKLAASVEGLGAAAYLGVAPKISDPKMLAAALSIHTVEGRHAAALNRAVGDPISPDGAFASPASEEQVLDALRPYLTG